MYLQWYEWVLVGMIVGVGGMAIYKVLTEGFRLK